MAPKSDSHQRREHRFDNWPLSRRSILKSGAFTSGAVALLESTGRAAARRKGDDRFNPSVPVIDSHDPDPDPAIVLKTPDVPIRDWDVFGRYTVADHNPNYDPRGRVVIVAFESLLDSGWPKWRRAQPDTLFDEVTERGIKFHAFPQARLERGRPNQGSNGR